MGEFPKENFRMTDDALTELSGVQNELTAVGVVGV
jgi:hypothetical protein